MNQDKGKKYDLEDRTLEFSKGIIRLCKKLPKDVINLKLIDQLIRASGSVGANYIETSESLSKKDFVYRIRMKETNVNFEKEICSYIQESRELRNIFTAILNKSIGK